MARPRGVTSGQVRELALALPGMVEGESYGTPAFKVRGKLVARMHQDGESVVVGVDLDERELVIARDPAALHVTDHYLNYPWVVVRLAKVEPDLLADLLEDAWRRHASKRQLAELDGGG